MHTVLLVDTQSPLRERVTRALGEGGLGCRLVHAQNGAEAIDQLGREPVHLAVVRRHLEGADGLEVVRRMRTLRPALPVVLLAGTLSSETHERALKAGVTSLVPETFEEAHFAALVKELLNRPAP
jgi:CheY-like chemotaxis protein